MIYALICFAMIDGFVDFAPDAVTIQVEATIQERALSIEPGPAKARVLPTTPDATIPSSGVSSRMTAAGLTGETPAGSTGPAGMPTGSDNRFVSEGRAQDAPKGECPNGQCRVGAEAQADNQMQCATCPAPTRQFTRGLIFKRLMRRR